MRTDNYETINQLMYVVRGFLCATSAAIIILYKTNVTISYSVLYGIHEFVGKVYCSS